MDLLVTGGAGFIGGHLSARFLRRGHDVTVLDNLDPDYNHDLKQRVLERCRRSAAEGDGRYELVFGDIRDAKTVEKAVSTADYIFHQAAQTGVRTSVEIPTKLNETNVDGTINVLEAARNSDIERVVVASSSSVYGKPQYLPYDEVHPTTPVSPYGVSKLAAEQYVRVYSEIYGLPTVSLRYFTVYGPWMRPNMAISNFVSRCLHGESPVIYGDGSQTRDFTYVDDILWANERLLETDVADGEIMNVGSTDNIDIKTLAEVVRDQLAPELELQYGERNEADAEHTHADISKANELLGYEPTTDIREGVSKFIEWYRANEGWYDPLVRNS
ncbi:GDP-mannose 4,6-dehydratase [Halalkalicoccus subterraneus]|uniref:GDP-mannose 4,6-dehydratase n=1 Tax=Halalkalicoccus subterraneus TaxID=2675002 RepID=UPI000EFD8134|nr:GDP-mannose 4,6-dehydratase [Halalkalicoccus subterraneus]